MHISEQKTILRQEIKKRIEEMTDGERRAEGRTVSRVLLEKIPKGSTICGYFPLKSEVDIQLLLKELLTRGDTVYLPVYNKQKNQMIYRKAESLADLPAGEFTIPEPPEGAEELGEKAVDIILVPGRAFTMNGHRLGRGSGGYDQWLSWYRNLHPHIPFWGVAFQCQIVREVPVEAHDVQLDEVVTAMQSQ